VLLPRLPSGSAHLGLIGKRVTFGAAMIGAMRATAQLKAPIPVTAFIPTVENLPGSSAQRSGTFGRRATLTGAVVVALGHIYAGVLTRKARS